LTFLPAGRQVSPLFLSRKKVEERQRIANQLPVPNLIGEKVRKEELYEEAHFVKV
jgi:hypothetical protein